MKKFCFVMIGCILLIGLSADAQNYQYKRIGLNAVADLLDGKTDAVIERLNKILNDLPGDAETQYCLALAHAQKGDMDTAMGYVEKSIENGLDFGRYLAGPKSLLKPLESISAFRELEKSYKQKPLHGPMVGHVTADGAQFWVRTNGYKTVQVAVSVSPSMIVSHLSDAVAGEEENDYTAVCTVEDLNPNTKYFYRVLLDGKPVEQLHTFHTFDPKGTPTKFTVGFGGGAGYTPKYERIWNTIAAHSLDAFLFLGDNVYIDNPKKPDVQRYCYTRRQSRPEYRRFVGNTPIYAIWDDHDFTVNDGQGGPKVDEPAWKIPVWKLFKTNWVNPGYGGNREEQPGCWFSFSVGDVDFIMLDGRYYRENPRKVENPSMLGPVQKQWLFDTLKQSEATFKVLASPVPWAYGTKPGSPDPWQGFKQEREEIFSFIEENQIEGVFLIAADRHRSDAWKIYRENGYSLYEFESSRLSNMHYHREMPQAIFSYNDTCSFGTLSFDTTLNDPEVTYTVWSIDDEKKFSMTLKRSRLAY